MTDVSTTCVEAIFRVKREHRLSKRQSLTTVLLRIPITQMIFFNQSMLLLGSNHFLIFLFIQEILEEERVQLAQDRDNGSHLFTKALLDELTLDGRPCGKNPTLYSLGSQASTVGSI